jgi:excisionase family DNA binding protein
MDQKTEKWARTCSVPEAGEVLGIGRNAAYAAAQRGEIPVIQIGKKKRVSAAWIDKKLEAAE